MSRELIALALLVVVFLAWRLFGRRWLASFLISKAGESAVKGIGTKAIEAQPDWITLNRVSTPQWKEASEVQAMVRPLVTAGFTSVGVFTPDKMAGVLVQLLVKPEDYLAAHVYEHPKAGMWIEIATGYEDGSSATITTAAATGLSLPPFVTTIRAEKAPSDQLAQRLVRERKPGAMKPLTAATVVREFEENYAKSMLWRKNTKVTPQELTKIVTDWSKRKDGEALKAEAGR
jgi:hypothetical protein